MAQARYETRRGEIAEYFDHTATEAWARLTSDEPVSRIRATVRAGREQMKQTLLSWLPDDLQGKTVLDAGCGTGMLALEAARRGADVLAIDLSPRLVALARERLQDQIAASPGSVMFASGDMLRDTTGSFDYTVAMDSLIHYAGEDIVDSLAALTQSTRQAVLFTYAPGTPLLLAMHRVGKLFPKRDRSPSIAPISTERLQRLIADHQSLQSWEPGRSQRIASGFYKSQALELIPQ
jgi:magnesium-protoporphyrin O-methyltransferase